MHVLITCKYKRIGSKTTEKRWRHRFPHYKSMGAFCCHGNQRFDPIHPKTLCSLSPTPVMLHIKFDQDWATGFRDIQVWKSGRRRRRTDDGPLVYYKLTLWAFGSGELKNNPFMPSILFLQKMSICHFRDVECFFFIEFIEILVFNELVIYWLHLLTASQGICLL